MLGIVSYVNVDAFHFFDIIVNVKASVNVHLHLLLHFTFKKAWTCNLRNLFAIRKLRYILIASPSNDLLLMFKLLASLTQILVEEVF